jgi:hypothetical protein
LNENEFKVGDRVEIYGYARSTDKWNGPAVVTKVHPDGVTVDRIGAGPVYEGGYFNSMHVRSPAFVHVVTQRTVWVTLPGDNAGHKLSEDDAQALFRQLEAIL